MAWSFPWPSCWDFSCWRQRSRPTINQNAQERRNNLYRKTVDCCNDLITGTLSLLSSITSNGFPWISDASFVAIVRCCVMFELWQLLLLPTLSFKWRVFVTQQCLQSASKPRGIFQRALGILPEWTPSSPFKYQRAAHSGAEAADPDPLPQSIGADAQHKPVQHSGS